MHSAGSFLHQRSFIKNISFSAIVILGAVPEVPEVGLERIRIWNWKLGGGEPKVGSMVNLVGKK